ncbi:glycosyltransferase family 39 protein [Horticoccus luteus]|uniref:Glycosyltransferase family 39 protein n=1 Tax=Horticoccus luteus TaxID=2862869 RepID=A0A8F9TUY8_9BACT|nr:glycosyltransferase family 39 protein [Horticoccus luteus]QYM78763.1 glycosyltransferase family 39 protein [Horticoccus luteus]
MNSLLRHRSLWLLSGTAALALVLGFLTFTPDQSMQLVIYGGYWALLLITVLFGWALWRVLRPAAERWRELRGARKWPAVLVLGCGLVLLVQESFGFKILMDEVMLLGTSMSLHFDKTALVPTRGHDIQGAFQLLSGQLDKRPLFHPFLLSLLHDFTGYRPENAFVLNVLLTFTLLGLVFHVGRRLGGMGAGAAAVLLLTSLPLLSQNATGGGFEILNLVMILVNVALALRYAERLDDDSLNALCLAAVLLALTRYESVLFLLPIAAVIACGWWRQRRLQFTWAVWATPLLLLPVAWHNRVFSARDSAWELAGQPGAAKPFALRYVPDNIQHALNFFFDPSANQGNSLVLSVLGFLALPFLLLWLVKILRRPGANPAVSVAFAWMAVGFLLHGALMMVYFWGKFDDPVIRRLSLPENLFLALAVIVVVAELARRAVAWRVLIGVVVAGMFFSSLPAMARHAYSLEYYVGRETAWRREFIAAHPERDYLVIDANSIIWITHLVSSTPVLQALEHKDLLIFNFQNRTFSNIYVFQRFDVDPKTGALTVQKDDDIGPDYHLATVQERQFSPMRLSRISRVTAIDGGPTTPPTEKPVPLEKLSREEREKVRQAYFEHFIQELP